MVTAAETKAKKNRSTKAAVKKGVMAARKYLRQHPHATLQDLITHTGLSGPTLSRHLTKVGKKKASKKGPHQDKAEDFMMLTEAYNKAKEELDAARENLIAFIQTGKL